MIRATTPTHNFDLPFDTSLIQKIKIAYSQNDKVILCKSEADCTFNEKRVTVKLTQEETALFDCRDFAEIQIRVLTLGNDALASEIMKVYVGQCLDDEVMT